MAAPARPRVPPRRALALATVALVAVAPLLVGPFELRLLSHVGLNALVALGLVLLTGFAGLASLGQAAFVGTGAYAAAILAARLGVPPWLALAAGVALPVALAWGIGLITLRLRGHFLALATLAWGLVITGVLRNWVDVTGGNSGFGGAAGHRIPPLPTPAGPLLDERAWTWLIWLVVLLALRGALNLMGSRLGRAIRALRTGEVAAASFGVDVQGLKMTAFLIAAGLAGLSGGLFAFRERFLDPGVAGLEASIDYLVMTVLGGVASLWGALFGSALFVALEELLQEFLPALVGRSGNFEGIAFGLILIAVLHRARRGLLPLLARFVPSPPPAPVDEGAAPLPPRPAARRAPRSGDAGGEGAPLLELRSVTRAFGGLLAVDDLSFEVRRGEIVGLIGPNGAGKSTVFNLVTGVLRPTGGEIRAAGARVDGLAPHRIARLGLARTFQHLALVGDDSLLDNVALGAHLRSRAGLLRGALGLDARERERVRAEALRQLRRVGLEGSAFDAASNLPLGKQRLVEVARALAADPALLLLDEPAAGLRKHEKGELVALVRRLRDEGVTVLLVEHDMEVVMGLADRIVVLNHGSKLAEGPPAAVRRDPAVLEAYLGRGAGSAPPPAAGGEAARA